MTQPPVFNWATAVGGTVIGGLTLTAAEWVENINQGLVSYGVIEYSCSGSPDLSGVLQGHRLVASGFSSDLNNGTFPVLSANNSTKKIRVLMTARKDDGADETGASASGEVITSGALLNPPTTAKQAQGYVPNELPNALQLNWMLNSFGAWTGYIATGAAGVILVADLTALAAIDTTGFTGRAALVADIGVYRWVSGSALTADGYTVVDSSVAGQWVRQTDMGDFAPAWLAPDIVETLPAVTATLDFPSISSGSESTLTVPVPGARSGDFVIVQEPDGLNDGLIVRRKWVSAKNTVSIRLRNLTGGSIDPAAANWRVLVSTGKRIPPVMAPGIEIFEQLLGGDLDDTALEALLADGQNEAHFRLLVASRQRMQALLDNTDARAAIEGSAIADGILTEIDGAGY